MPDETKDSSRICDVCGASATYFITEMESGKPRKKRFCGQHIPKLETEFTKSLLKTVAFATHSAKADITSDLKPKGSAPPISLAVLISGGGTTLQNLIDQIAGGTLDAKIAVVVASKPGIAGIERAGKANIPCHIVERSKFADVAAFSEAAFAHCEKAGAELVCLAGWLPLVKIPTAFVGKVMNIHPSLLPSFGGRGMYGRRVHEAVLEHGCKISGCTVHFVDDAYDAGPIILQRAVRVREDDTPDTLAARVFEQEQLAYPIAIELFRLGRLRIEERRVRRSAESKPGQQ